MNPTQPSGAPEYTPPASPPPVSPVYPPEPAGQTYVPPAQPASGWQQPAAPQPFTASGAASLDYLNHIAPAQKSGLGFSRKQLAFLGGGLLLAFGVLAAFLLSNSGAPDITTTGQSLVARLANTSEVVDATRTKVRNRDISVVSSTLSLQLIAAHKSMASALAESGIATEKLPTSITLQESTTELQTTLDNAYLNGNLDAVYVREISYKLQTILLLMKQLRSATQNSALISALDDQYASLDSLHTTLSGITP